MTLLTAARMGGAVLALILAGCASNPPTDSTHVADSGAQTAGQTNPTPPPVTTKDAGNPSRIHQLKDLKTVDVDLKGHPVHLWLMDDDGKREEGMMFLTDGEVKGDEGMLFRFQSVQKATNSFWMHNTILPLDIVYFSPQGKVLNVGNGKAMTDTPPVLAAGDYRDVIELKAGTAAKYGLKAGDMVNIPKG